MKLPIIKKNILPILSGIEIGIPINLMSKISMDSNFLKSPLTPSNIFLNFLLGFSAYKGDRYLDAIEYKTKMNNLNYTDNSQKMNNLLKSNYYDSILNNNKEIEITLFCSYLSLCILSIYYHIGIIFPLFTSTFAYKYLKQNKNISFLKPFYVAGMWTFCTCMIPLLLNDLQNTLNMQDYYHLLSPMFLSLFSTTNLADFKDIDEDLINGVNTLPIILGSTKTKGIILASSILSIFIFLESEYFTWSLQNYFFIASGILPNFQLFNFTNYF